MKSQPVPVAVLWRCFAVVVALVAGLAGPVRSETLQADPLTFDRVLEQAAPGDTLVLAPGRYGVFTARRDFGDDDGGQRVTVRSADPENPARFEALKINKASGLTVDGLVFDYRYAPDHVINKRRVSEVNRSRHITIRNSVFDGDRATGTGTTADGYGAAFGLSLRWAEVVLVENSIFRTWFRGIVISQSEGLTLRGNEIYDMRSDGANFAEVRDVVIEGNHFHSFIRDPESKDHSDMIQFWTASTKSPSRNITIRDNILNSAGGAWTQSIFMRNELVDSHGAGLEMFYRDLSITGNVIINAHLHGITVGETMGLQIAQNTLVRDIRALLTNNNAVLHTPSIRVASLSTNVRITNNITANIEAEKEARDWRVLNNLMLEMPSAGRRGNLDDIFVAAQHGDPAVIASFAYLPEGSAGRAGIGAPLLRTLADSTVAPLVQVVRDAKLANRFTFDAQLSAGARDTVWTFDTGTTAAGVTVTHDFARPGQHRVRATNSAGVHTDLEVSVPHPQIITFDGQAVQVRGDGGWVALEDAPLRALPEQGRVLSLGQGREVFGISKSNLSGFFGASGFALNMRLRVAETQNPTGEILRIHNNLIVSMTPMGGIAVLLNTSETPKPVSIKTGPLRLFDSAWHDVGLQYDARTGQMLVTVDGQLRGQGRARGDLRPIESWGLSFGNPFGKKTFDGEIALLELQAGLFAAPQP